MCCAIRIGSRNKIIAGASASVMNASVQNAFAFALGFYQSALHLCESKSREPTERRDRTYRMGSEMQQNGCAP